MRKSLLKWGNVPFSPDVWTYCQYVSKLGKTNNIFPVRGGGGVKFLPLFENLPILLLPWPANVNLDNVLKIYVSASDLGIKKSTKSILFLTFQRYFRYLFTFFCALSLQQTLILIFFSKTSIIPFFFTHTVQYSTVH